MRRVASGDVALDAPASRYLPALRGTGPRSPTVRELLQHRAGSRRPEGYPESLDWCLSGRGAPGGQWAYNNCDYQVLGAMLERLERRPLPELFAAEIAGPAGIDARFVVGPGDPRVDATWPGGPTDEERAVLARFGAAGGLVGTAEDLLAFDRALLTGAAVSERVRGEMWRGDPKLGFQALGQWAFDAPLKGCAGPVRLVERRGAIGRFQVRNFIAPDRGLAFVMLTNRAEGTFDFGEIWQGRGVSHDVLAAALCPGEGRP
jgi:D-alanyl-D-alanine carboxypeptidase